MQTFREIREDDCYYVDKTAYMRRLVDEGKHYFLSRPRRFGKSLPVDTLKELFEGSESLFRGLDVHDHWDWSMRHPVVRLSFGSGDFKEPGYLQANLMEQLDAVERGEGVTPAYASAPGRFGYLIESLRERAGQRVVVLLLFDTRQFKAWWFETGTPTFLVETLVERGVGALELDGMLASDELLSSFDVEDMATEALLFQTGTLTILDSEELGGESVHRLGYPNREVRQSLNRSLLNRLTGNPSKRQEHGVRLLKANDFAGLEELFRAFFASIPCQWHRKNDIADYEGYYASVFYSCFAGLGLDVTVEDSGSRGRLDMAVVFSSETRNLAALAVERA